MSRQYQGRVNSITSNDLAGADAALTSSVAAVGAGIDLTEKANRVKDSAIKNAIANKHSLMELPLDLASKEQLLRAKQLQNQKTAAEMPLDLRLKEEALIASELANEQLKFNVEIETSNNAYNQQMAKMKKEALESQMSIWGQENNAAFRVQNFIDNPNEADYLWINDHLSELYKFDDTKNLMGSYNETAKAFIESFEIDDDELNKRTPNVNLDTPEGVETDLENQITYLEGQGANAGIVQTSRINNLIAKKKKQLEVTRNVNQAKRTNAAIQNIMNEHPGITAEQAEIMYENNLNETVLGGYKNSIARIMIDGYAQGLISEDDVVADILNNPAFSDIKSLVDERPELKQTIENYIQMYGIKKDQKNLNEDNKLIADYEQKIAGIGSGTDDIVNIARQTTGMTSMAAQDAAKGNPKRQAIMKAIEYMQVNNLDMSNNVNNITAALGHVLDLGDDNGALSEEDIKTLEPYVQYLKDNFNTFFQNKQFKYVDTAFPDRLMSPDIPNLVNAWFNAGTRKYNLTHSANGRQVLAMYNASINELKKMASSELVNSQQSAKIKLRIQQLQDDLHYISGGDYGVNHYRKGRIDGKPNTSKDAKKIAKLLDKSNRLGRGAFTAKGAQYDDELNAKTDEIYNLLSNGTQTNVAEILAEIKGMKAGEMNRNMQMYEDYKTSNQYFYSLTELGGSGLTPDSSVTVNDLAGE